MSMTSTCAHSSCEEPSLRNSDYCVGCIRNGNSAIPQGPIGDLIGFDAGGPWTVEITMPLEMEGQDVSIAGGVRGGSRGGDVRITAGDGQPHGDVIIGSSGSQTFLHGTVMTGGGGPNDEQWTSLSDQFAIQEEVIKEMRERIEVLESMASTNFTERMEMHNEAIRLREERDEALAEALTSDGPRAAYDAMTRMAVAR